MALVNISTFLNNSLNNISPKENVNFHGEHYPNIIKYRKFGLEADKFNSNPLDAHLKTKAEIEQLARSNPRIMALLKEYNLPLRVNIEALEDMR